MKYRETIHYTTTVDKERIVYRMTGISNRKPGSLRFSIFDKNIPTFESRIDVHKHLQNELDNEYGNKYKLQISWRNQT